MSSPSIAPGRHTPVFSRAIPLSWILLLALLVHGPLLLMQIPNDSYDAYLHQFFASHYRHRQIDQGDRGARGSPGQHVERILPLAVRCQEPW